MLTIYRRHRKSCKQRMEGRGYRRCLCPIWVDGSLNGLEMRKSLRLRDWQRAQILTKLHHVLMPGGAFAASRQVQDYTTSIRFE